MAEHDLDARQIEARVHDLKEAMERAKRAQADRDDVVVDMKQAARARLELLAQDLVGVMNQIPAEDERFDFALTNGETPRLWVDMTSHVRMGRDRRTYEFVKDTRLGRALLSVNADRGEMAKAVTDYVAERILERERAIEGDWQSVKAWDFERGQAKAPEAPAQSTRPRSGGWRTVLAFVFGALIGAAALVALAWFVDWPAGGSTPGL